jgi:hypothetical protein
MAHECTTGIGLKFILEHDVPESLESRGVPRELDLEITENSYTFHLSSGEAGVDT